MRHVKPLLSLFVLLLLLSAQAVPALAHGDTRPDQEAILLVAFGSSMPEGQKALKAFDAAVRSAFPGVEVRWAWTSRIIRDKLTKAKTAHPGSPALALAQLAEDGYTRVAVQSLHSIPGEEFTELEETVKRFDGMPKGLRAITLGRPLLSTPEDLKLAAKALLDSQSGRKDGEAVLFMGHGTGHPGNAMYPAMQYQLWTLDPNAFLATVEGTPALDDVLPLLKRNNVRSVRLVPLMAVAGDHAHNDMAGKEEDSFASQIKALGIQTTPVLRGLAETPAVSALWLEHLRDAVKALKVLK
ncbi:sirohydrochlorin cobaltochelatase [Desulfovibrio aminophilus]|uniref:sirohydrochlorin cobaltochelatase n=1 Tax=Desulfovibrio aminophilus TaxID=81425 RepID=UPI00339424F8